tara:strand:+ start:59 stop:826 length:768 start_codon:yes stop_codon:yes gene_type:complete
MFGQGLIFGGFSAVPLTIDYFLVAGGRAGNSRYSPGGNGGGNNFISAFELESGAYTVTVGGTGSPTSLATITTVTSAPTTTSPLGTFNAGNPIGPGVNTFQHGGGGAGGGANGQNSSAPNTFNQFNPANSPAHAGNGGNGNAQPTFGGTWSGGGGAAETVIGTWGIPNPWISSYGGSGGGSPSQWLADFSAPYNNDAAANTGGGGGGMYSTPGQGGSGIAKIRYLTADGEATGGTITTSGAYKIHTFTTSGTFTY